MIILTSALAISMVDAPVASGQFLKCTGAFVSGSGGRIETRYYSINLGSIRRWDDNIRSWKPNYCSSGAKCSITNFKYHLDETYKNKTGQDVNHTITVNRETGKVEEIHIFASTSSLFSADCATSDDPSNDVPVTKF